MATRIVSALDAITRTVVRFLESTRHVRVMELSLDYAVDDALRAWLLWASKVVRGSMCHGWTQAGPH